jgi:hypothetical protein
MGKRKYQQPTWSGADGSAALVCGDECERPIVFRRSRDKWRLVTSILISMGARDRRRLAQSIAVRDLTKKDLLEILAAHEANE